MATFKDIVDFIVFNKKDSNFITDDGRPYTIGEITYIVQKGIDNTTLCYCTDDNDNVTGIILAEKDVESKVLYIFENLAMSLSNLREIAKRCKEVYPDFNLEWRKKGLKHKPNTDKFYQKIGITI